MSVMIDNDVYYVQRSDSEEEVLWLISDVRWWYVFCEAKTADSGRSVMID